MSYSDLPENTTFFDLTRRKGSHERFDDIVYRTPAGRAWRYEAVPTPSAPDAHWFLAERDGWHVYSMARVRAPKPKPVRTSTRMAVFDKPVVCVGCGETFLAAKSSAQYCSPRCRHLVKQAR